MSTSTVAPTASRTPVKSSAGSLGGEVIPQYAQLAEHLQDRIASGELKPGEPLPTLRTMRKQGFNQFTLDKAHDILEQQGLIVREPRRGTFVAHPHQRPRTGLIGLFVKNALVSNVSPYWTHLIEGIHDVLDQHHLQLLLITTEEAAHLRQKLDGALLNGSDPPPGWFLEQQCPGVLLLHSRTDIETNCVEADSAVGIRLAMDHLTGLGHKKIGFLHSNYVSEELNSRIANYCAGLLAAGIAPQPGWMHKLNALPRINFFETGRSSMEEWLQASDNDWRSTGCTALLAQNDEAALGAITALRDAGLRVPEDVSVVGFDGTELGEMARPRLTSVEVPLREIGQRAAEILVQNIESDIHGRQYFKLPVSLRVRESTAPPPAGC